MKLSIAKEIMEDIGRNDFEELLSDYDEEVILAAYECDVPYADISEAYEGEYGSDEDFTQNLLEDTGDITRDLPHYIHIDWESTARDIMMDYCEHDNHYFRIL